MYKNYLIGIFSSQYQVQNFFVYLLEFLDLLDVKDLPPSVSIEAAALPGTTTSSGSESGAEADDDNEEYEEGDEGAAAPSSLQRRL